MTSKPNPEQQIDVMRALDPKVGKGSGGPWRLHAKNIRKSGWVLSLRVFQVGLVKSNFMFFWLDYQK